MQITQFTGESLLNQDTVSRISQEADIVLKNKDVALAWQASTHLKQELASMPKNIVAPVLDNYRSITSKLKALALPLLLEEDVENLLENNLEYLDTKSEDYVVKGLTAWLASQSDENVSQIKEKLQSKLDKDSPFAPKIMSVLSGQNAGVNGDGINTPDKIKHDELLDFNEIKDINNSTQKLEEVGTSSVSNSSAESIARQIYSESNSKESEQDFVKRALALAISRIRDVRTPVEINEYLKRPFAVGGLGLAGEELESAIKKIQEAHARYHIQTQNPIVKPIAQSPQISDSPQKPIEQAQKATQEIIQQPLQNKITQKSPSNTTNSQKKLDDLINQESTGDISIESILKSKPKKPTSTPSPYTVQQNYFNRSPVPQGKVRIDDIKPTHKSPQIQDTTKEKSQSQPQSRTTGLSDELSAISLSDYRALGNAQQAEQYILKKILLLGQNSLEHKLKGIANFRNSSLVNQYINIGDASLSKDKNLANILSDSNINPENMTQDEFFAISTLNSKLK